MSSPSPPKPPSGIPSTTWMSISAALTPKMKVIDPMASFRSAIRNPMADVSKAHHERLNAILNGPAQRLAASPIRIAANISPPTVAAAKQFTALGSARRIGETVMSDSYKPLSALGSAKRIGQTVMPKLSDSYKPLSALDGKYLGIDLDEARKTTINRFMQAGHGDQGRTRALVAGIANLPPIPVDASRRELVELMGQQNDELRKLNDQQAIQLAEERAARAEDKVEADRRQKRSDLLAILGLVIAVVAIVVAVATAG